MAWMVRMKWVVCDGDFYSLIQEIVMAGIFNLRAQSLVRQKSVPDQLPHQRQSLVSQWLPRTLPGSVDGPPLSF